MATNLKISEFANGGSVEETDEIAAVRSGVNTKVFVGSAAALNASGNVGDVVVIEDIGGKPSLPQINSFTTTSINDEDPSYLMDKIIGSASISIDEQADSGIGSSLVVSLLSLDGFIQAGSNVSITGAGTESSPFIINASGEISVDAEDVINSNSQGNNLGASAQDAFDNISLNYGGFPIGVPFDVWDHIDGVLPPDNSGDQRFIKLTIDLTGSGEYNEGLLDNQDSDGSGATIQYWAFVADSESPIFGERVELINSMDAVIRASETSGVFQADQMQVITGSLSQPNGFVPTPAADITEEGALSRVNKGTGITLAPASNSRSDILFNSENSPGARTGDRTRDKSISATKYMRIR